ncbi:MAG: hypothetical protein GF307_13360 [candidate division Zixibacteria bacterium]|nr:hypothetical protein [candidate division Zixibacteria bacterium]
MGMFFYNILITAAVIITSPILLWLGWAKGHRVRERVGIYNGRLNDFLKGKRPVWFHAASVGEVRVLAALIPAYIRTSHEKKIVVSCVTKTGRQTAEKLLPKECLAIYAPLDIAYFVRRAFKNINPKALVIAETEFWPNMLETAKNKNVRTFCINGRISKKSFPRYRLIKPFMMDILSGIECFFMQSSADAERIIKLGVDESRVVASGNIKYDLSRIDLKLKKTFKASRKPGWLNGDRVLVAGSTHKGEEKIILKAFGRIKNKYPNSLLIIAPRHLSRLHEVQEAIDARRLKWVLKSEMDSNGDQTALSAIRDVVILDTMGELQYVYKWGEAAFVGGSLDKTGGHNPLEPAAHSVPVAFGPNMQNCYEISRMLIDNGGARTVANEDDLYEFFDEILSDSESRKSMGTFAGQVAHKNNGVADKVAENLFSLITSRKAVSQPAKIFN